MTAFMALLLVPAQAQTRQDQEYRDPTVGGDDKLTAKALFETEYYEFSNLDFRPLDESSDQAILDSDDRGAFAFTGGSIELAYQVDPHVRFVVSAGHRGLWGDDQIGSVNEFGGFLYFPALYADLSTAPENGVRFRVGRQFFTLGGLGSARDYTLADILDMVRVDVPLGTAGSLTLVPLNVFSVSSDYAEVDFVGLLGQQFSETFEFRGDTLTRRYGLLTTLDGLPGPVDASAYLFYSDVGARGTGSDISYDGLLGNFADNDWVTNVGVRGRAAFGPVAPFAHFDLSAGIDRKELVAEPVDCFGFALGGGLALDTTEESTKAGATGELRYFTATGPAYAQDGLLYSHGYVGMKGNQAGGTVLNRFMGWHPSAYLGRNGVSDQPQDQARIAGTMVISANGGYEIPAGFRVWAGWWTMLDNGLSFLRFADLDNITPPYGYSRSEFEAEQRLGLVLAHEVDLEVGYGFGEYVEVYANGGYVIPGAFYGIEIDRIAGTALGAKDPVSPWAVYGGTRVTF